MIIVNLKTKKNIHTNLRSMNDNMKSIAGKRNKKKQQSKWTINKKTNESCTFCVNFALKLTQYLFFGTKIRILLYFSLFRIIFFVKPGNYSLKGITYSIRTCSCKWMALINEHTCLREWNSKYGSLDILNDQLKSTLWQTLTESAERVQEYKWVMIRVYIDVCFWYIYCFWFQTDCWPANILGNGEGRIPVHFHNSSFFLKYFWWLFF